MAKVKAIGYNFNMKIAFFTDTYLPQLNGVATSVNNFYQELKKINPDINVIAPEIKNYHDSDENIIRLSSSKVWPTIPDSARIPLPDREWLQLLGRDYEIVHAHGNGLFSFLGLILARRKKIPFILTFHTLVDHYGHYFFGGKILTPKMINKLLKTFANKCDAIISPSEKMKNKLIELGVKRPVTVIPNFIDFEKFSNNPRGFLHQKLRLTDDNIILLSVGRLGKEKNFDFLIKMFSCLKNRGQTTHLVIVGEGPENKNLAKQIKQFGLESYVHLTGGFPVETMPAIYADADIFVFASKSEVHPMVAIEAAASGLPLVVVKDPAFKGVVEDKVNGFITDEDLVSFTQKVELLLEDQALRKKMGQLSQKNIKRHFVKEVILKDLLNVYQTLLDRKHQRVN